MSPLAAFSTSVDVMTALCAAWETNVRGRLSVIQQKQLSGACRQQAFASGNASQCPVVLCARQQGQPHDSEDRNDDRVETPKVSRRRGRHICRLTERTGRHERRVKDQRKLRVAGRSKSADMLAASVNRAHLVLASAAPWARSPGKVPVWNSVCRGASDKKTRATTSQGRQRTMAMVPQNVVSSNVSISLSPESVWTALQSGAGGRGEVLEHRGRN